MEEIKGQKPEIVKVDLAKFLASRPKLKAELQQKIQSTQDREPTETKKSQEKKKAEKEEEEPHLASQPRRAVLLRDRLGIGSKQNRKESQKPNENSTQRPKSQENSQSDNKRRVSSRLLAGRRTRGKTPNIETTPSSSKNVPNETQQNRRPIQNARRRPIFHGRRNPEVEQPKEEKSENPTTEKETTNSSTNRRSGLSRSNNSPTGRRLIQNARRFPGAN